LGSLSLKANAEMVPKIPINNNNNYYIIIIILLLLLIIIIIIIIIIINIIYCNWVVNRWQWLFYM